MLAKPNTAQCCQSRISHISRRAIVLGFISFSPTYRTTKGRSCALIAISSYALREIALEYALLIFKSL